jgi:hypothetical protein
MIRKQLVIVSLVAILGGMFINLPLPANCTPAPPVTDEQDSGVMNAIRDALRAGNSRELARHFDNMVELTAPGVDPGRYTRENATAMLKREFFDKYPPNSFTFVHQGVSNDGAKYGIGQYTYGTGVSFRVVVFVKKDASGVYRVKHLNITREED